MGWYIIPLIIVVIILGGGIARAMKTNYRMGSGMFKSSEYNLDEKDEVSDKDYYDKDGLMK